MPRLLILLLALPLSACIGPQLGADISVGPYGTYVSPSVSAGLESGGFITYSPP